MTDDMFDAFISYNHAADGRLATELRDGLQKFAKPWNQRRAMRVFLDRSSLELTAGLGDALQNKLGGARYLILLASAESAASPWCNEEARFWIEQKGPKTLLLVLTDKDASIVWDDEAGRFDPERSTALPPALIDAYPEEPLWMNMAWVEEQGDDAALDLRSPQFRDAIATLSATIQGKKKDELDGEDVRQHNKFKTIRSIAIGALTLLTVVAIGLAIFAANRAEEAKHQEGIAVANATTAETRAFAAQAERFAPTQPQLGLLLAAEASRLSPDAIEAKRAAASAMAAWERSGGQQIGDPLTGHSIRVLATAFHPDGQSIATADDSGRIYLWRLGNDRHLLAPGDNGDGIRALQFTPDGEMLASVDREGRLRFWRLSDDETQLEVIGETAATSDQLWDVSFSPDGARVAAVGFDGMLRVWDTNPDRGIDPQPIVEFEVGPDWLYSVEFSPVEPDLLATGGRDGTVSVFRVGNELAIASRTGIGRGEVRSVAFGPSGEQIASGDAAGHVQLWNWRTAQQPRTLSTDEDEIQRVAFSSEGVIAAVGVDGLVHLWDSRPDCHVRSGCRIDRLVGHTGELRDVQFTADGQTLATTGFDLTVRLWNVPRFVPKTEFPDSNLLTVDDARQLVVIAGFSGVRLVDDDVLRSINQPDRQPDHVADIAVSTDGDWLAWGTKRQTPNRVVLWNIAGEQRYELLELTADVRTIGFSQDGRLMALTSEQLIVWPQIVDPATAEPSFRDVDDNVADAAFLPQGALVITYADGAVRAQSNDGTPMWEVVLPRGAGRIAVHGDGAIAIAGLTDSIYLTSIDDLPAGGYATLSGHSAPVLALAFSHDGLTLASASRDSTVRYWDLESKTQVAEFRHPEEVADLAMRWDDRAISISNFDPLEIWGTTPNDPEAIAGASAKNTVCSLAMSALPLPDPAPFLAPGASWHCEAVAPDS